MPILLADINLCLFYKVGILTYVFFKWIFVGRGSHVSPVSGPLHGHIRICFGTGKFLYEEIKNPHSLCWAYGFEVCFFVLLTYVHMAPGHSHCYNCFPWRGGHVNPSWLGCGRRPSGHGGQTLTVADLVLSLCE